MFDYLYVKTLSKNNHFRFLLKPILTISKIVTIKLYLKIVFLFFFLHKTISLDL